MTNVLYFAQNHRDLLAAYLPPPHAQTNENASQSSHPSYTKPFITLTYATSLDSQISLNPGAPTPLSGPASKSMTHYLRSVYDAILVGSGTAIADDPTLNSRLEDVNGKGPEFQPRPIILDRRLRWNVSEQSKVVTAAREGKGKGPFILYENGKVHQLPQARLDIVQQCGGDYLEYSTIDDLLIRLWETGTKSIMIEGGGQVINNFLTYHTHLIDSIIVTIAPIYLGQGGVLVSPQRTQELLPVVKFFDVQWMPLDNDVVMCARIKEK